MSKKYTKDSLGERMKMYENSYRNHLPENLPIIIRLDGAHFHTFTKGLVKPFDEKLMDAFAETCKYLAEKINGVKYVYHQSDEISLLIRNDDNLNTQPWFKNNLQKLVSISASLVTAKFNEEIRKHYPEKELATFDSRVFILPEKEVHNYFVWRQNDCMRNAVSMVAQSLFSQSELSKVKKDSMIEKMLNEKDVDFYKEISIAKQRGTSFEKEKTVLMPNENFKDVYNNQEPIVRSYWKQNLDMPILSENKEILYKYLK